METKKWYSSKTMWVAIATSVVGILMAVSDSLAQSGQDTGLFVVAIGLINAGLRFVTGTRIE